jgi:hypothetical protein
MSPYIIEIPVSDQVLETMTDLRYVGKRVVYGKHIRELKQTLHSGNGSHNSV